MGEYGCFVVRYKEDPVYELEWYGMNQHGEETFIADTRYACKDFTHLRFAAKHEDFGGFPDAVLDVDSLEKNKATLEKVLNSMVPSRRQLELFSEKRI